LTGFSFVHMVSAYAENEGTSESGREGMAKADDIKALAAHRVRELMSKGSGWEQAANVKIGGQTADLVMKFKMGDKPHTLAIGVSSLGQPRQIRETVTRLLEIRKDLPEAYPVAVSPYISPQSASLLKRSGLGYLDLSGNCYLSFENVLIEKEGKPPRPSNRPLKPSSPPGRPGSSGSFWWTPSMPGASRSWPRPPT
jgi:hypothetical protein